MATSVAESPAHMATNASEQLMQIATGFQLSACLYVAAKLNIADLVAHGGRSAEDLAASTGTNADALYRVLRALISVGIFAEPEPRIITLSPAAEPLRRDVPGSVHGLALWVADPFMIHIASDLLYSVETGKPAVEHLYGKPAFECIASIPRIQAAFNEGMTTISREFAPAVLEAYDFSGIEVLMDVAGGHGYFIGEALRKHPRMKGILLDLPHVVEGAKGMLRGMGVDHRCEPMAGDFFEEVPSGADAYYLQHIIHDWDDEHALKILRNIRKALTDRNRGRLLVVDAVLPENSNPHPAKLLDLVMLTVPGGRERTEPEWHELCTKSGFKISRIVPTRVGKSVIEAFAGD
jgi:O-methyltransferase/methyltransferase family protein